MNLLSKHYRELLLVSLILILASCSTAPRTSNEQRSEIESTSESIDELIATARRRSGQEAATLSIRAMEEMLVADLVARATAEAVLLNRPDSLPAELQMRFALVQGEIALRQQQPEVALRWLTGSLVSQLRFLPELTNAYYMLLGNAYREAELYREAASAYIELVSSTQETSELNIHDEIWNALSKLDDDDLNQFATNADSYEVRGWIELTRVLRVDQFSIKSQLDSIAQWRRIWSSHSAVAGSRRQCYSGRIPECLLSSPVDFQRCPTYHSL